MRSILTGDFDSRCFVIKLDSELFEKAESSGLSVNLLDGHIFVTSEEGFELWNHQKRRAHRGQFPLSDHLFHLDDNGAG